MCNCGRKVERAGEIPVGAALLQGECGAYLVSSFRAKTCTTRDVAEGSAGDHIEVPWLILEAVKWGFSIQKGSQVFLAATKSFYCFHSTAAE